jgi:hypothetical protein
VAYIDYHSNESKHYSTGALPLIATQMSALTHASAPFTLSPVILFNISYHSNESEYFTVLDLYYSSQSE